MEDEEHLELIAAIRAALSPFKEELKVELLEPMETRLRGDMGEMEAHLRGEMGEMEAHLRGDMGEMEARLQGQITSLRGDMGKMETRLQGQITSLRGDMGEMETRLHGQITNVDERLNQLTTEVHSLTNDIIRPFIDMVAAQHHALVERLDRLERRVERNSDDIGLILGQMSLQERRLLNISDDVIAIRQRLNALEQRLSGEVTYDVTQAELVVAEERSVYEMIRALEERVALLEAHPEKGAAA